MAVTVKLKKKNTLNWKIKTVKKEKQIEIFCLECVFFFIY